LAAFVLHASDYAIQGMILGNMKAMTDEMGMLGWR
jgi:hypothetical protein